MKELPIITLNHYKHKTEDHISLSFKYNEGLIKLAKYELQANWNPTHKVWYIENKPSNLKNIFKVFKGTAFVNSSALFEKSLPTNKRPKQRLTKERQELVNRFRNYLKGKRYSKSTIETYSSYIAEVVSYYNQRDILSIDNADIDRFVEEVFVQRHYSISTHRQFISALKLFAVFLPESKLDGLELRRPTKSRHLPTVLSQEEIIDLLRASKNLKHRAVLALLYSAGLRISELLNMELKDISIDRRQLIIRSGKGRKDRYVVLAQSFIPLLQNYVTTYRPERYFVEGKSGEPYSASSVRKFLHRYCKAAKISRTITPHTLRHSYATHLLEQGTDLRYIQALLGHARPETTMIYTHVARKDLLDIQSPLDVAVLALTKQQKGEHKFLLSQNINR